MKIHYDDHFFDEEDPEDEPERDILTMVRRIVGVMLADSNPGLGIECLALVTGIAYEGNSMTEIAKKHRVTRASVSQRCVSLSNTFGLEKSMAMRNKTNRAVCKESRLNSLAKE